MSRLRRMCERRRNCIAGSPLLLPAVARRFVMHSRPATLLVLLAVALAALAVRCPRLAQRPMHGDEAVQCDIFRKLWETGQYRYDPEEYHGPTLPYATWPVMWLSGARTFENSTEHTYRAVALIFGLLLILMLPLVADGLGTTGTIIAAVLTAASPAMIFFSRYYIHEMLLVVFTFGAIACAWRFYRGGGIWWAAMAGAFVGLMHATKETWVLAAAAATAALVLASLWGRVADGRPADPGRAVRLCGVRIAAAATMAALAAIVVAVVLFSSFFTHLRGPLDSVLTYKVYFQRGTGEGVHNHPWYAYLKWFFWYRYGRVPVQGEWLVAAAALAGLACALWPRRRSSASSPAAQAPRNAAATPAADGHSQDAQTSFCRFMAFYALALTAVYSAVSYKTPWCALSFLHAMILLGACGIDMVWNALRRPWLRALPALALAGGLVHLGHLAYRLNYVHYADYRRNPMVYGHPNLSSLELVKRVDEIMRVSPAGADTFVSVITKDCWPLPWYFRRYRRVGWWQEVAPENVAAPVILTMHDKAAQVNAMLRGEYQVMHYGLRPGVPMALFVRMDLWERYLRSRGLIQPQTDRSRL